MLAEASNRRRGKPEMSDDTDGAQAANDPDVDAQGEPPDMRSLGERLFAGADQFAAVDLNAPIRQVVECHCHALEGAYSTAFKRAEAEGDEAAHRVYLLLANLVDIRLTPEDRAQPWQSMIVWANGSRSAIPDDFRGAQTEILAAQLDRIQHPVLRARIADIVWTNDRARAAAADIAIDAYCECAEGLLSGRLKAAYEKKGLASFDLVHCVQRALQLAYARAKKVKRRAELPDRVKATLSTAYDQAVREAAFVVFCQLAQLALNYALREPLDVARDAERVAGAGASGQYAMAVQGVWELGAHLYHTLKDDEGRRRCQIGALDQTFAMRKQVGSAGAEAHWVMEALQALRHISGMDDLKAELESDLRRLQKASLDEMTPFSITVDVTEEHAQIVEFFDGLSLSDSLAHFAFLSRSPTREDLRKEALEDLAKSPLGGIFAPVHLDGLGKQIAKAAGAPLKGEPDESWFLYTIDQAESRRRQMTVEAAIDPARAVIAARFNIAERHFRPIVGRSPLVPQEHELLMALGFARLFQGDHMSATHLLVPQLEPCLRQLLRIAGYEPAKRRDNGTEEDLDLVHLLNWKRAELDALLTPPIAYEIERLFTARPGPAIRHAVAHGLIGAGGCYHYNAVYSCWLIYRLCVLTLANVWKEHVAPELELEA